MSLRHARSFLWLAVLILSTALLPMTSQAETVYSDLGSSPVYDANHGYVLSTPTSTEGITQYVAMPFTPAADYDLTQIDLAIEWVSGVNSFTLDLVTADPSNHGFPTGSVLDSWTVVNMPTFNTCCSLDTVTYAGAPILLQENVTYWLRVEVSDDTYAVWDLNNTGATHPFAAYNGITWKNDSGSYGDGAFDVLGNPPALPEPSAAALLGTALTALLGFFRIGLRKAN